MKTKEDRSTLLEILENTIHNLFCLHFGKINSYAIPVLIRKIYSSLYFTGEKWVCPINFDSTNTIQSLEIRNYRKKYLEIIQYIIDKQISNYEEQHLCEEIVSK